ncbi:DUF3300 domain-containing protein [Colwellia sp. 12G3]|uniref:DUF3300 domain-containing protein n=1 Tax=Colwellia sp. 12G3 TaxID=2058299 RepID=UPI001E4B8DE0|nr:DUF3300 domain-containing protein [Colwellia sp. 12G3]
MNTHQWPCQKSFKKIISKQISLQKSSLKVRPLMLLRIFSTLLLFLLSTAMFTTAVTAQAYQEPESVLSEAELAQTLAPIALYPDTLLTHILIAATYPLEVIEAERWLTKHSTLTAEQLQNKAESKEWDASIKALLSFSGVMAKLSENLNWMQTLGDAFLQDESRVLASIQTLRQQAEKAGSLANMNNVQVIKEQQVIIIEPAQPEIIYVPYYDTRVVYGRWHWSHYPPVYWHHPNRYASYYGPFYWGHGVHISSQFFFSAFHWHNRHVVVSHYNRHGYHPRKKIVNSHHAKRWNHQPKHRRGVAYSSGSVKKKYYSGRPSSMHQNKSVQSNRSGYKSNSIKNNQQVKAIKSGHSTSNNAKTKNYRANQFPVQHKYPVNIKQQNKQRVSDKKAMKEDVHQASNKQYSIHKKSSSKQEYRQPVSKPSSSSSRQPSVSKSSKPVKKPSHKPSNRHAVTVSKQHKSKHN